MSDLSRQNLRQVYKELDEIGVAIGVVGTRRQKLMELARMTLPISDALVGTRPEVKRARDDLVRLAHNVRRANTKARSASKAVKALAAQIKVVQKLVGKGLGDVPEAFDVGGGTALNVWGYTPREAKAFLDAFEQAADVVDKMGLTRDVLDAKVVLDPEGSPTSSMTYDLFPDVFVANPSHGRGRERGISDAIGGRLWVKVFEKKDVDTWGGSRQAWKSFSSAFHRLLSGKNLDKNDAAKMAVSLGRVIGPENWRRVA